jgi:hypothetical protein
MYVGMYYIYKDLSTTEKAFKLILGPENTYMYVCICMYVYMCTCAHILIYTHTHVLLEAMFVRMYLDMCMHVRVCWTCCTLRM